MTTRLFVCIVISTLLHALVIIQPWNIIATPENTEVLPDTMPVYLADEKQMEELMAEIATKDQDSHEDSVSFDVEGNVSADYMELLKMKIFNAWEYPQDAIKKGYDGTVKIAFVIDKSGKLEEIGILTSSGHYSLDTAAMAAIEMAGPFGPFTEDVTDQELKITGNFKYVLE